MKNAVRSVFRNSLSPQSRGTAKRWLRRLSGAMLGRPLSHEEFRFILQDRLGVTKGTTVLVHCSFGRLKGDFKAEDAIVSLKEIVGGEGNILMPCYPGNSEEWIASRSVFDVKETPVATGILAQAFAKSPGVKMSAHPIKAVAAWGKDRDFFIGEHHLSKTPYDFNSPYAKMLCFENSLVVGLGTAKMSFYHCCEDSVQDYAKHLYTSEPQTGLCRTEDGDVREVSTLVHRADVLREMASSMEFLTNTRCPEYSVFYYRRRMFYTARSASIYNHVREQIDRIMTTGETINSPSVR